MFLIARAAGVLGGAFAGLMLGTMIKFSIGGDPVDLRYAFMLVGILIGYAIAWVTTRQPVQVESNDT